MENIHRRTKLGETLDDTLEEMIAKNMITNQIKDEIFKSFDKIMLQFFRNIKAKATLKGNIFDYGNCDNVWDFNLKDIKVTYEGDSHSNLPLLKILALDYSKITNADNNDKNKKINNVKQNSKKTKKK